MEIKEKLKNLKEKLPKSKSSFLIAIGIFGLLLLLISSFDFGGEQPDTNVLEETVQSKEGSNEYTDRLETKLEEIISDMLGGTKATVMITLESGIEYIYADEVKTDADLTRDQAALKTQQSDSNHKTYITVKDADGNERPLVVTEKMPVVRGVVVVCESGETSSVAAAIRLAIKSALNVDENKICIIGRS